MRAWISTNGERTEQATMSLTSFAISEAPGLRQFGGTVVTDVKASAGGQLLTGVKGHGAHFCRRRRNAEFWVPPSPEAGKIAEQARAQSGEREAKVVRIKSVRMEYAARKPGEFASLPCTPAAHLRTGC